MIPTQEKIGLEAWQVYELIRDTDGVAFADVVEYFEIDNLKARQILAALSLGGYAIKNQVSNRWSAAPAEHLPPVRRGPRKHTSDEPNLPHPPKEKHVYPAPVKIDRTNAIIMPAETQVKPYQTNRKPHPLAMYFDPLVLDCVVTVHFMFSGSNDYYPVHLQGPTKIHFGDNIPDWGPDMDYYRNIIRVKITYRDGEKIRSREEEARNGACTLTVCPDRAEY